MNTAMPTRCRQIAPCVRSRIAPPAENGAHTEPEFHARQDWFCDGFYGKVLSTAGRVFPQTLSERRQHPRGYSRGSGCFHREETFNHRLISFIRKQNRLSP